MNGLQYNATIKIVFWLLQIKAIMDEKKISSINCLAIKWEKESLDQMINLRVEEHLREPF